MNEISITETEISSKPIIIFSKATGNANNYRIPSVCYMENNRVLSVADERFFGCGDNPNRIDKVVRISNDNGESWGDQITAVREMGLSKNKSSAAIDASTLYDPSTDTVFLLYSHTPAGVGILNCKRTTGYFSGNKVLVSKNRKYEIRNNELFWNNRSIKIKVDSSGNISNGGNYKDGTSVFKEVPTSYLMLTKSHDGGQTWDVPICLNNSVKSPRWGFIGACPGSGIRLTRNSNAGRLVFPIYYGLNTFPLNLTFSCIFSDDGGINWSIGTPPEVKGRFPAKKPFIIPQRSWLSETQLCELENGDIQAFIRNHHPVKRVMCAKSTDGGLTFGKVFFHNDLPQPICQISALSFLHKGINMIAVLNPNSEIKREKGTIRLSIDGGKTFPYSKVLSEGDFAYSSIAYLGDGNLGILYEDNLSHNDIKFVKICPDDLLCNEGN
ncbi:MAG: Sialidase A precursor [Firmicutes bacterium ADurb.Bin080]|nr:MAG: Sialidase A precursor [Firmicutes bacterium ADurb.Bin080]